MGGDHRPIVGISPCEFYGVGLLVGVAHLEVGVGDEHRCKQHRVAVLAGVGDKAHHPVRSGELVEPFALIRGERPDFGFVGLGDFLIVEGGSAVDYRRGARENA